MSAKRTIYDGLYQADVSAGDRRIFMKVPDSSAVSGLCYTERDVSVRHLIVKYKGQISQGNISLKIAYPAISTPPVLVLDESSPNTVLWDIPFGLVTTTGTNEGSSAIRVYLEPSDDLYPDIEDVQVQIVLEHDDSEDWLDLVAVYSRSSLRRNATKVLSVSKWGDYVSPDSANIASLLIQQRNSVISRGTAEVVISVNGSPVKSVVIDKNTPSISSVDLLSDDIPLVRGDEVSMVVKTDRKFRPNYAVDLYVGLEVQHI